MGQKNCACQIDYGMCSGCCKNHEFSVFFLINSISCINFQIKIGDGLPTKICDNCLQLLQLSFLFRLRVITANENYKEIIRTAVSSSPRMQSITDKQTTNLSQIYSTEYILESINESVQSLVFEGVKEEP